MIYCANAIFSQIIAKKANCLNHEKLYQPKVLNTIKILLLLLTFGFIIYKLFFAYHFEDLISNFNFQLSVTKIFYLILVFVLMTFNWIVEAVKWKLLINKNEQISLLGSLKAVVSGIALSIITPNQIGDFAGRIIHLKKFDKIKGTLVTVIGHTSQVILTLFFGLLAFTNLLFDKNLITVTIEKWFYIISSILFAGAFFGYLNIRNFSKIITYEKIKKYVEVFGFYSDIELLKVFIFSFIRYLIFILQYSLLLNFFNVEIELTHMAICISAILCAQSFVPSFLLVELGLRGASALYFFTIFSSNTAGILLSAYSLWIINLMIPAVYGLFVILKMRFNK